MRCRSKPETNGRVRGLLEDDGDIARCRACKQREVSTGIGGASAIQLHDKTMSLARLVVGMNAGVLVGHEHVRRNIDAAGNRHAERVRHAITHASEHGAIPKPLNFRAMLKLAETEFV